MRRSPDKAISKEDKEGAREVSDIITSQVNHLHYVTSLKYPNIMIITEPSLILPHSELQNDNRKS